MIDRPPRRSKSPAQVLLASATLAVFGCSSSSDGGSGVVAPDNTGSSSGSPSASSSGGGSPSGSSGGDNDASGSISSSTSGGTASSGSGGSPISVPDGGCPELTSMVVGVHVKFQVTWPSSTATNQGTGPVEIWLLTTITDSGSGLLMQSGNTRSCGTNLPDIDLNQIGAAAVCAPNVTCGTKVQIQIPPSTFDKITRVFPTTGSQTSWDPGGTITYAPALGLLGLSGSSSFQSASTAWPPYCASNCTPSGAFSASDVTDDDMDGQPGITASPKSDPCTSGAACMYTLPSTSITPFSVPPLADQVNIVSRSQIGIAAMRMTDCTHAKGTAKVTLFDNHVVGCHIKNPAAACTSAQVSFLDQNRTIYGPDATHVASPSTPIMGTATAQQLPTNATCADVRAITN